MFQPGITDVRAQVTAMAPWVTANLGKRVTMMFPDYAFGYDHRDHFSAAVEARGGSVAAKIAIPPTESSYTKYFPQVPADTEVLYHVMVGPGVLTFVKEMGEHYGSNRPQIFGFIDSLEGVDMKSPGLEFLEGTYFWEAMPRYADGLDTAANRHYRGGSASTTTARASTTRRTSPPTRTCSAAGRRSTRSSRGWSRAATAAAPRATSRP